VTFGMEDDHRFCMKIYMLKISSMAMQRNFEVMCYNLHAEELPVLDNNMHGRVSP
jgi:hypothetical protein